MQNAFITELPPIVNKLLVWEFDQQSQRFKWLSFDNSDWKHYVLMNSDPLSYYSTSSDMLLRKIEELLRSTGNDHSYTFFDTEDNLTLLLPIHSEGDYKKLAGIIIDHQMGIVDPISFLGDKTIRQVLNFLPIDLVLFDSEQRFLFITDHAIRDKETREWLIGKTEIDLFTRRNRPLDLPLKRMEYFRQMMANKQTVTYIESDVIKGRRVYKSRSFHPILDSNGDVYLVVGYGIDTTHLMEKEHIINRQNLAIEKASDGIAILDKHGCYYYLNDAHIRFFGYSSASELIGKSWKTLYGPEELERIDKEIFPLLASEGSWTGETVGLSKQGEPVFQEITLSIMPEGELLCICRDFSERKKQADEIRKLALVVENTNSVVIITDEHHRIEWANKAFMDLTGYQLEEVIEKNPTQLLAGPDTDVKQLQLVIDTLQRGESFGGESINYKKSGEPYWVSFQVKPLTNQSGKMVHYFAVMEDITYRKNIEKDLIIAKEAAEASARSKRRFLANMSHEIRTPMNAVLGLTEQLLKTELTGDQRILSETISQAANNLLTVINDILDISKLEEGKVQIENIPMTPKVVIERAINVLMHKAEEKGLQIIPSLDKSLNQLVLGDPYRLNQVLLNVIGNGIKFTHKGEVIVKGTIVHPHSGDDELQLEISDTGIGMDNSTKENIFTEFSQGDQSFVRKYGGSGLGLSITKTLVELMGGRIAIQSIFGKGTSVLINIPYTAIQDTEQPGLEEEVQSISDLTGRSVLLVEDNKFNSMLASMILKKSGIQIHTAFNGKEALDKLANVEVDVILMDIQMPEMDGVTATSLVRSELKLKTPIIALTAHALREEKEIYLRAGMDDFLSKPFTENELLMILSKWIH